MSQFLVEMDITVIVCTFNRCLSLTKTVDSLLASVVSPGITWEILIADNNSTDRTREVAEHLCVQHPGRCRYLFEPHQGKSYALNSAIESSRSAILAFVDDDIAVEPHWLQDLTGVLRSGLYAGSAGRILPDSTFRPPAWLAVEGRYNLMGAICPSFDQGPDPLDLRIAPFGGNMAFRREMFDKYGKFRVDLGPSSKNRVSSEDTEFGQRLLAGGEQLRDIPTATVHHEIHSERIDRGYFLKWWQGMGIGAVRGKSNNLTSLQAFKAVGRTLLWASAWLLSADPARRFYCKCQVWFGSGKIREAYRRSRKAKYKVGANLDQVSP